MIATVTSKGQVTLPAEARRQLGIRPGTQLEFLVTEDGHLEVIPRAGSLRDLKGIVPRPKKPLSQDDIRRAIAEGASS